MGNKIVKKRNWAFVVYPDSLPEDWLERLQLTGLPCVVSPLHDKDLNANGEPKKPHRHVIAIYSGPTSYNVVKSLTDSLNATIPQALESVRGYFRYLTHKDNPEKAQYDEKDIISINGFNIADFVDLTKSEVHAIKRKVQQLIRDENITEYAVLLDYLLDNEMLPEHDVASSNTLLFNNYIASRRNMLSFKSKNRSCYDVDGYKVDSETGEILEE